MKHVFVESNWVFAYIEPRYTRTPAAEDLVKRAVAGELTLHIPAICLREGAASVRSKCTRHHPKDLAGFRRFLRNEQLLSDSDSKIIERFFEQFQQVVQADIDQIDSRIADLVDTANVEAFPLSETMLRRVLSLRDIDEVRPMKPFDEAILGAVLERTKDLRDEGATSLTFCTLDSDLWPVTKKGEERRALKALYDSVGLSVINDFNVS